MVTGFGSLGTIISIGVIGIICFILLRCIKDLLSMSFIGFVLSLISYFVYDYVFATVPVIAAISLVLSVSGFSNSGVVKRIFSLIGMLISGYIILRNYGILA